MIIIMASWATPEHINGVMEQLRVLSGESPFLMGREKTVIGLSHAGDLLQKCNPETWPGVEKAVRISTPYKLASRELQAENSRIEIDKNGSEVPVVFGGEKLQVIAGPCAIENETDALQTAKMLRQAGCKLFRGAVFKPRSSPYAFQGLGKKGLEILQNVRKETGLLIVTEVMEISDFEMIAEVADVIQVGSRNMSNFPLLKFLGETSKPILLKRGMSATVSDLLMSAEYILSRGNSRVILCERGIRTFETATRNTLDINAIPVIKRLSHLPIIVDPSHGTGHWRYVEAASLAAIAAGADGLMIEVHPFPHQALSDGKQSILLEKVPNLMRKMNTLAHVLGRILVYNDFEGKTNQ